MCVPSSAPAMLPAKLEDVKYGTKVDVADNPNVPGYNRVLEKEYVVQCPKDYDGLVLCAHQRGETFEQDEVNKDEAERIEELITITERENKDATKTLRFRIK